MSYSVLVGIPSLWRPELLDRAVDSLFKQTYPISTFTVIGECPQPLTMLYHHILSTGLRDGYDIIVLGADYLVFEPDCMERLVEVFDEEGTTDLAVGLYADGRIQTENSSEYWYIALGSSFIDRFGNMPVHCPQYYHLCGDIELGAYARKAGVYRHAKEAKAFSETFRARRHDATYQASRSFREQDKRTFKRRNQAGLLWGDSFDYA